MAIFPCVIAIQLHSTHFWTDLGEGQRPVNCPTRPLLARVIADFLGRDGGRETSGISSSFLINLETEGRVFAEALSGIREAKSSAWFSGSGGGGGRSQPFKTEKPAQKGEIREWAPA